MGWPTYLHNLQKADLIALGKHWSVAFDENTATVNDLRLLLKSHVKSQPKTEADIPDSIDKSAVVLLRARSPSPTPPGSPGPKTAQPQFPQINISASATNDPIDKLTNALQSFIVQMKTASIQQGSPPAPTGATASVSTIVDRDRRVKNVIEECDRQNVYFSGRPGENVNKFIIQFEEILNVFKPHDSELQRVLYAILSGPAKVHLRENPDSYKDWSVAKTTLKDVFLNIDTYDVEAKIELLQRKQKPNEPMAEFISSVKLLNKCLVKPETDGELIRIICKNCHPRYYKRIRGRTYNSIEEIRKRGQEMENLWYEEEHYEASEDCLRDSTKTKKPRSSSVERDSKRECYGCYSPGKTLRDCSCERARRYQASQQNRTPPRESSDGSRRVRFDSNERNRSPHSSNVELSDRNQEN